MRPQRSRVAGSRLLAAVAAAVAMVAIGAAGYAAIPGRDGVITACAKKRGGALRVIDHPRQRCRRDERRVQWDRGGRPGASRAVRIVDGGDCGDVQKAIDGLPAAGGLVLVRPGTYVCTAPIVVDRDDVALRGSGTATRLELAPHVNRPLIVLGQTAARPNAARRRLRVSDLLLDGNRARQDHECGSGPCTPSDHLRNNGISLRRVEDVVVERVVIREPRSGGLVTELGSRRVTVSDLTVSDAEFDGVAGYETESSVFTRLYLHDNAGAGLSFDIRFDGNVVSDSVIEDSGDLGIFMRDSRDNLFTGVTVARSADHGIFLAQVDADATKPALGNTFSGVVVSGSGADPAQGGHGIRVNDASCVDNLLSGVQLAGNRDGGVSEATPGLLEQSGVVVR